MLRAHFEDVEPEQPDDSSGPLGLWGQIREWVAEDGPWWAGSFVVHLVLLSSLMLVGNMAQSTGQDADDFLAGATAERQPEPPDFGEIPPFSAQPIITLEKVEWEPSLPTPADTGDSGLERGGIPTGDDWPEAAGPRVLTAVAGPPPEGKLTGGQIWTGFHTGPGARGLAERFGDGTPWGVPGGKGKENGGGYAFRGKHRFNDSQTRATVSAKDGALHWIARHQFPDGHWGLDDFHACCRSRACTNPGAVRADSAATAMSLMCYLAAGQTHTSKGIYQKTVHKGIQWLLHQQKPDGDLRCGSTMYAHGLATIALCEAYGMTGDRAIGYAAQNAINFIQAAQNKKSGGWRYQPGEDGDLSIVGWQVMALKSAQMAGLTVDAAVLERAKDYIRSTSSGSMGSLGGGLFAYQPGNAPSTTMTSVGLLCSQYLGAARNDPAMVEGTAYLMRNLPDPAVRNVYYWYYAAQVMHNQPGPDWDTWNRRMRNVLVESQVHEGCEAGSWDPLQPAVDAWGKQGGRLMMTCLSALTLEVYYRFLPLYNLDGRPAVAEAGRNG